MELPIPTTDNYWLTLIVFILFGSPALLSKGAARIPGFLGATGRWWQRRVERSQPQSKIVTAANLDRLIDERVSEKIGHVEEELLVLQQAVENYSRYLVYDASWHRTANLHAAEIGFEFPPPPHETFLEWRRRREEAGTRD